MKPNAFMELVIIIVFMMASVPLLRNVIYQINNSEFTYMQDKSALGSSSVDMEEVLMPDGSLHEVPTISKNLEITTNDLFMTYVVFDEYAPDTNIVRAEYKGNNSTEVDFTEYNNFMNKYDYFVTWQNDIRKIFRNADGSYDDYPEYWYLKYEFNTDDLTDPNRRRVWKFQTEWSPF